MFEFRAWSMTCESDGSRVVQIVEVIWLVVGSPEDVMAIVVGS